jgi:phosphoglucosamine mutase
MLPTPAVAWAVASGGLDLGIAVSASHNPPAWNGVKPFARGGRKLEPAEEEAVERLLASVDGVPPPAVPPRTRDGAAAYVAATAADLRGAGGLEGLRVVVDLSGGAASATAPGVLEALGAEVVALHEAGSLAINDGCGTEHPARWLAAVREAGAAAGLAFDGDADRVLWADAGGELLDGDDALLHLAADLAAQGRLPGRVVVSTVMANLAVEERLGEAGIALERVPVGDRNVAARMRETGAVLGTEPSGHVVLPRDGALIGDGLVAGVRLLQAARRAGRALADLRRETPRYPQVHRRVRVAERRPIETLPDLVAAIAGAEASLRPHGRMVVRYSGTEPLLRIMAEGRDAAAVQAAARAVEEAARPLAAP